MKRRSTIAGLGSLIVLAAVAVAIATRNHSSQTTDGGIPVAEVKRGDLDLRVHTTGELRPTSSMVLIAPPVSGGALQITRLARTGNPVRKGEVVVEFDPAEQLYKMEQSRSELFQAEQEIIKAKADDAVQVAEDKVALLKARFDVRRAELDVQKEELVSQIDAKKNELALQQAQKALAKLEKDIQSHTASGQASIALALERKNKARLAMKQAADNIARMRITAPMDGLIAIEKNENAMGEMMARGMSLPDYRAGDQIQPGSTIAQVVDLHQVELIAKIPEVQRSNVQVGEAVEVKFNAQPGHAFRGTVKNIGGMVRPSFWEMTAAGKFETSISLVDSSAALRPGLTAEVDFLGDRKRNVLYIPTQALQVREGKRVVFVKRGDGFEQKELKVLCENESHAAVEGLNLGDKVALLDPASPAATSSSTAGGKL